VNNMRLEPPKGMKDCLPEEQILREELTSILRKIFRNYGFSPLDTPALENLDLLTIKGGGGSEIGKEIFTLTDRAGRKLGLRFDLTLPLARIIASTPNLSLPFKRYQIGKVWRQEFGTRTREFEQCDVDIVGSSSPLSDAEMIAIASDFFKKIGVKVVIRYNSRELLKKVLTKAGVPEDRQIPLIMEIDKLEKGTGKVPANILRAVKSAKVTDDSCLAEISKVLKKLGVKEAKFDSTLARGLEYYTGPIFEVYSPEYKDSIAGGGRYDNLLKLLGGRDLPATGISFGLTRICEILSKKARQKTVTQLFVIPIKTEMESAKIASELRKAGINTDMDLVGRSISKNLAYANNRGIPFVLFVGPDELKKAKVKLRDMQSGKEQLLTVNQVVKRLK